MLLTRVKGSSKIIAETYSLTFVHDRPFVYLQDTRGKRLAELFVLSGVHPLNNRDDTIKIDKWVIQESAEEITLSLVAWSSVWERKIYRFRCHPRRFLYEVEVEGSGNLFEVDYFGGYSSALLRWGSGFFWSGQYFKQGFNFAPNASEVNNFRPGEGAGVELMGVPLPGKSDWFFTPPPFCFAFEGEVGWVGMGVAARPGENRYTEFRYHGGHECFYLALSFEGHPVISGRYQLPAISFEFEKDAYASLEAHIASLRRLGCVPQREARYKPAWWYEPIFCGWGSQSYLAERVKGKAPAFSRQGLYEQFLEILEANAIHPGIVVLDDKWQATYGENRANENRWPDLSGFIACQHEAGRKVLLWLKAWDPEGIPVEECITNAAGLPLAVDPTNPAFVERLRASVRQMLSPEGYDADGFKIDFTARIPSGPGLRLYGEAWGLELMRLYLEIIYCEAKRVKPDALIMAHAPHPYLADVMDMIRLNDINKDKDVVQAMTLRARVAEIACPEAIIDTDNWPIKDLASWREYLALQPQLGVPSLYYVSHIDSTKEPLEAQDYELIRQVWAQHRSNLAAAGGRLPVQKDERSRPVFSKIKAWWPFRPRRKPAWKSAW